MAGNTWSGENPRGVEKRPRSARIYCPVMTGEMKASRGAVLAALMSAAALGLHPASVQAGDLRDGLFKKQTPPGRPIAAPPVACYQSEDGRTFVLDRTQRQPLLRFAGSQEIWALAPQPAPRGDVIYKNDLGEPVLRATRLGGFTLFTDERPNGAAVSMMGPCSPVRLTFISLQVLGERLLHNSVRTARLPGREGRGVVFQAEATPASTALMGDAAMVATLAFMRLVQRPDGRAKVARISKVQLVEGKKPGASLKGGVLWITVTPGQNPAGRPSSDLLVRLITRGK
jgi:hypothetical protein